MATEAWPSLAAALSAPPATPPPIVSHNNEVTATLYHKKRGGGGKWVEVTHGEMLRVTKHVGKRVKLVLRAPVPFSLTELHLMLLDLNEVPKTPTGNSSVTVSMLDAVAAASRDLSERFSIESTSEDYDGNVSPKSNNSSEPPKAYIGQSVIFGTHNSGKTGNIIKKSVDAEPNNNEDEDNDDLQENNRQKRRRLNPTANDPMPSQFSAPSSGPSIQPVDAAAVPQVTIVPREPVSDVLLPPGIDPHVFHSLNPEQRASVVKAAGVMKLFGTKFIAPEAQARRSKIAIYVAHNSSKCTYQTALYKSRDRVDCETLESFGCDRGLALFLPPCTNADMIGSYTLVCMASNPAAQDRSPDGGIICIYDMRTGLTMKLNPIKSEPLLAENLSELSPPSEDDSVDDGLSPVVESMSSTPIPFTFSNVKSELVDVLKLAVPVFGGSIFQTLLVTLTLIFVGHLTKSSDESDTREASSSGEYATNELAAASISFMFCNVTGYSIGVGLLTAMDTICSQSFGAGNYHRVGLTLQRALVILGLLCIPIATIWIFTENILVLVGIDPEVAALAGKWAIVSIPGLPFNFVWESIRRYLQTQGITLPQMIISFVTLLCTVPLGYVLVLKSSLGYLGAPVSVIVVYALNATLAVGYVYFTKIYEKTWPNWVWKDVFSEWKQFFALGIPGAAMVCAEWWSFELYALLSGWISRRANDETYLATQTVLMNTCTITFMLPLGFSIAANTIVGNKLGAGQPNRAAFSAKIIVLTALSCMLLISFVLFIARYVWGGIFSDDPAVVELAAKTLPLVCLFVIADGGQGSLSGILRGSGRQKIGAGINLVGYYAIGLPIAAALAFAADLKLSGLWIGFAGGSWIVYVVYAILILRSNWPELAVEAQKRAAVQGDSVYTELAEANMITMELTTETDDE